MNQTLISQGTRSKNSTRWPVFGGGGFVGGLGEVAAAVYAESDAGKDTKDDAVVLLLLSLLTI